MAVKAIACMPSPVCAAQPHNTDCQAVNVDVDDGLAPAVAAPQPAIAVCVEQLYAKLCRFFETKTGNPDDALDLTQQLWLQMCENARRQQMPLNPEGYVFASAHNLLKDFWRGERSRAQLDGALQEIQHIPELAPDTADCASNRQLLDRVQAVLQTFPPRTREVFIAHALMGVSKHDLAQQYGVDRSTIDRWCARVGEVVAQLRMRHRDCQHGQTPPAMPRVCAAVCSAN